MRVYLCFTAAEYDMEIPHDFLCPVTLDLMTDPVVLTGDGHTYSRAGIQQWLLHKHTSPKTNEVLGETRVIPNHHLRSTILEWIDQHAVDKRTGLSKAQLQQRSQQQQQQGSALSVGPSSAVSASPAYGRPSEVAPSAGRRASASGAAAAPAASLISPGERPTAAYPSLSAHPSPSPLPPLPQSASASHASPSPSAIRPALPAAAAAAAAATAVAGGGTPARVPSPNNPFSVPQADVSSSRASGQQASRLSDSARAASPLRVPLPVPQRTSSMPSVGAGPALASTAVAAEDEEPTNALPQISARRAVESYSYRDHSETAADVTNDNEPDADAASPRAAVPSVAAAELASLAGAGGANADADFEFPSVPAHQPVITAPQSQPQPLAYVVPLEPSSSRRVAMRYA
jgi:hypothetical protein